MLTNNLPLKGVRVIDLATMMAAPYSATYLGDFGAEVLKIEHPQKGDNARAFGEVKDGKGIFWKSLGRNKKCVTLNIQKDEGREIFLQLLKDCDILIENFRPGTMEKWGYDWEQLSSLNPGLVWLRCSGFGQEGPYAKRGGFGTVAEAMSSFVAVNGYPDSPPTLPPLALADGVCSIFGALACMIALHERDKASGQGQVIDITLYEPLMRLMEVQLLEHDVLQKIPQRMGNRIPSAAPRNLYQTKDGEWAALSASAQPIAEKVFKAIDREDLISDERFCDNASRVKNVDELDEIIGGWIKERSLEEVLKILSEAGAVVSPVYSVDQVYEDEHFNYRGSFVEVEDKDFGTMRLPNVTPKFSRTPGKVKFTGKDKGEDNQEVYYNKLGITEDKLQELKKKGVI